MPRNINPISKKAEELLRIMLVVDHRKRVDWNTLIAITEEKFNITIGSSNPSYTNNINNTYIPQ